MVMFDEKVKLVPEHIVINGDEIEIVGWTVAPTETVMLPELTVAGDAQLRLLVSEQLMTSLSFKVDVVYVGELVATLFPFFFH